jgi:Ca2+:H+ antiporter
VNVKSARSDDDEPASARISRPPTPPRDGEGDLLPKLINAFLIFVPLSLALEYGFHAPGGWVFATGVLAIVPLADWIRRATEEVALRTSSTVGGLLNVSFGNVAELLIGIFVIRTGQSYVVKGQITGSIIGNGLLGLGLGAFIGGWGRDKQAFRKERAGLWTSLLNLSVIALLLPALFDYTERSTLKNPNPIALEDRLSLGVSFVLMALYVANLIYTFVTHKDVFASSTPHRPPKWSLARGIGTLVVGTALVCWESELVSNALEATSKQFGLSTIFLGVTVLAIVGNASEYIAAIYFARQNRMGLVLSITIGSSIQVAMLIAPLLVFASHLMGKPINLVFTSPLELIAIAATALAVNSIAQDGETNWFEGLMLIGVYSLLAMAFYYVAPP